MEPRKPLDPDVRPEYPDITRVRASLRRWWPLLVVFGIVFALLGYRASKPDDAPYKASAQVLVGPLAGELSVLRAAGQQAQLYAEMGTQRPVLAAALRAYGSSMSVREFARNTSVKADSETRLVKITVNASQPRAAAQLANRLAAQIVQEAAEQAPAPVATPPATGTGTTPRVKNGPAEQAAAVRLTVLERAVPPPVISSKGSKGFTALIGGAGVLVAFAIGLLVDLLRRRIDTLRELEAATGVPAIGTLGRGGADASTVALARAREGLAVAGAEGAPAAALAIALGRALAADGVRTLLIDGDPGGALSRELGAAGKPGLLDALSGTRSASPVQLGRGGDLMVLPRGKSGRTDAESPIFAREDARRALAPLERSADATIVCAGPASAVAALSDWAPRPGRAVLAIERGATQAPEAAAAAAVLERYGYEIVGAVLVRGRRRLGLRRRGTPGGGARRQRPGHRSGSAAATESLHA